MKKNRTILAAAAIVGVIALMGSNSATNDFKYSKSLKTVLNTSGTDERLKVWIEFTDKGENTDALLSNPVSVVTRRSLERRAKVKPAGSLIDFTDLPVNHDYVSSVSETGAKINHRSKWFNRVSAFATQRQINEISSFAFVKSVDIVRGYAKDNSDVEFNVNPTIPETDNNGNSGVSSMNYGSSLSQMQLINAVTPHDSGYYGQGVLIASFDTGVDNLMHPAFDSIRARGLRTYDFVNHDTIISNQNGQMGEGSHGTETLSLVGGYRPGNLISPAFRSMFIVAKTENTDSETALEEDNWLAAAEWADSLGADIITSSLGYLDMDPGSVRSYDWTWMNGDSCFITIGADLVVNKGILICNSAGNEGSHNTHNTLIAPADGDSVFTIGSVNSNKQRSSFSSVGLTTDGRIKPDVCALGNGNVVASPGAGSTGYTSGSGTSFSCPMTAGVCAMVLSANMNLTPMQVMNLLRQTADSSFAPNRRRGWG
ncbi:MAG: S8 family serine peptidase, partial [Ignavibacteria bacterium]|nr:S8 family serine peptidase [Ignavibacteria bacterium]